MMEKAIKQRLLGGLVLVAGAALFLPVLLDGSGAGLTIPPLPKAPEAGGVEALAPRLDQKVAETEKAVDAAHAGRDETAPEAGNAAPAGAGAGDVAPDAAALAANEGHAAPAAAAATAAVATAASVAPVKPAANAAAPATAAVNKAPAARTAPAAVAPVKPAPAVAAAPPSAAPARSVAAPTPAPAPARPVAASPAPAAAKTATPATTPPKPAEAKDSARPAAEKPLPGAWLVQVGVFSSRDKAQALVQQLRHKGYAAVLNPQGGNFKVVVGPELNRSVADSIKARLAADPELKLNGWVQAYKP